MIIAITGAPGSGKTTMAAVLSKWLNLQVIHTDDFLDYDHDEQPWKVWDEVQSSNLCIVEGTIVARMLRHEKGYYLNPDVLIYTRDARKETLSNIPWVTTYTNSWAIWNSNKVVEVHR